MAHQDKLFEPFQRLHRSDEFEDSGIGLSPQWPAAYAVTRAVSGQKENPTKALCFILRLAS
jgi:light-regulated signal transduction histidine kinase (bacteriophytochrome)